MNPLVSVVIPNFNYGHLIGRTLDSIIKQTYTNWEIIIVDYNSKDSTDEVVKRYLNDRIKMIKVNNNGVIGASRNTGIQHSKGEWIALLDSDDFWYPTKLEEFIKVHEYSDVVYHNFDAVSPMGLVRKLISNELRSPITVQLLTERNSLINSSLCVRRELLNKINGFSELRERIAVEDYDLLIRLSQVTNRFTYIPKILGGYWVAGGNISADSMRNAHKIECVYQTYFHLLSSPKDRLKSILTRKYIIAKTCVSIGDYKKALPLFILIIKEFYTPLFFRSLYYSYICLKFRSKN